MSRIVINKDTDYVWFGGKIVAKPIFEYLKYHISVAEIFDQYGIPYTI